MFVGLHFRVALAACLLAGLFACGALGQGAVVSIGFRNELKTPVIVQGISKINGMVRRGPPILVPAGRMSGDFNVPPGLRVYSVYDAKQPSRVLARDVPVTVLPGRNLSFAIRGVGAQAALIPE